MRAGIDATVVRQPLTGVQYAVRHQTLALSQKFPEFKVFATDPLLLKETNAIPQNQKFRKAHWRIAWQQMQLPKLLERENCDWLFAMSYTAPRNCPVPFLLQVHDTIALRRPQLCSWQNVAHMKTLMPQSMKHAAKIICSSKYVADEIMALTGRQAKDIYPIPLGLDPVFYHEPAASMIAKPYILFVGNLEPKKGLHTLLHAYEDLPEASEYDLVLVGRSAWKYRGIENQIRDYKGPGRIRRLNYLERPQMPTIFAHAACTVLPSTEEGFGLPIIESLAMGTPVIHSSHPVLNETAGGFGISFSMDNDEQLKERLSDCIARPPEMQAAKAWATKQSWDKWAENLARIFP